MDPILPILQKDSLDIMQSELPKCSFLTREALVMRAKSSLHPTYHYKCTIYTYHYKCTIYTYHYKCTIYTYHYTCTIYQTSVSGGSSVIAVCSLRLFFFFITARECFSYLAAVTITDGRGSNLDLWLLAVRILLRATPTACDTRPPFLRSNPRKTRGFTSKHRALAKEQSLLILMS
jgi:hypothetical protein